MIVTVVSAPATIAVTSMFHTRSSAARQLFTADILPHLSRTLQAFIPPYPSPPPLFFSPESRQTFTQIDFEILEQVAGHFELLALDVEEVKLALARTFVSPEDGGDSALSRMLAFIEYGDYPPHWSTTPAPLTPNHGGQPPTSDEADTRKKGFDNSKAAIIKAVVEAAGDDKNLDVLWDENSASEGRLGDFVDTMVRWIRGNNQIEGGREDLLVCALVNLGNLCRKGAWLLLLSLQ